MGQGALELEGVCRRFGGLEAVRDVTLTLPEGGRQAIIGPNGAGKTTLFNLIPGEPPLPPRAGPPGGRPRGGPAAGLSPGERREMARFIKGVAPGLTILMIEHDMDVAFEVAETMAVLHFGRLVAKGTKEAVRADPTVQEIYLGAGAADGGRGSA